MRWKVVVLVGSALNIGSAIVTLYVFFHGGTIEHASELAITYFCILLGLSWIYIAVQDYRLGRKIRYAEVLGEMSRLYERIQSAVTSSAPTDAASIKNTCSEVTEVLAGIFDILTSSKTAVCVKIVQKKYRDETQEPEPIVVTLCRDSTSLKLRIEEDKRQHWLNDNTGFQSVWLNRGNPFFCNNLPGYAGYKNTSASGVNPWTVPTGYQFLWSWFAWPLKYRSTMIVAISSATHRNFDRIHGFLCVDSRSRGVFDDRYGIDILQGFSRAISPLIAQYHQLAVQQSPS